MNYDVAILFGVLISAYLTFQAGKQDADGRDHTGRGMLVGIVSVLVIGWMLTGDPFALGGDAPLER